MVCSGYCLKDPDKRSFVPTRKVIEIESITSFTGEFEFLSPLSPYCVQLPFDDFLYPTYEHALQVSIVKSISFVFVPSVLASTAPRVMNLTSMHPFHLSHFKLQG